MIEDTDLVKHDAVYISM